MMFTIAQITGILLGALLLALTRRIRPAWTAWLTLALGFVAALLVALGFLNVELNTGPLYLPVALPTAAVILAGGLLLRGDRRWQIWLGFILGLLPVLFWVYFVIGEITGPAH